MSDGLPVFRSGANFTNSCSHSGGSPGMVTDPGAIAFTRTSGASAFAKHFVNITTPALEIECELNPVQPRNPPVSEKFTIEPFERRSIGAAACAQKKGAFTF